VQYTVQRSARARRVRVTVDRDEAVRVTLPQRAAHADAALAIAELTPWIARRRAALRAARERVAPAPGHVPYLGGALRLRPQPGRTRAHRHADELLVPAADPQAAIERWYRRAARVELEPLLAAATAALGCRHAALTIRDQRTRWGSCSSTGAISLNWRLLLAPADVAGYVVWHEACHLVVADHSQRFWALLEDHLPGYRVPRRWLRDNGAALALPA
jgi:predicted metal-dependent hydrolase